MIQGKIIMGGSSDEVKHVEKKQKCLRRQLREDVEDEDTKKIQKILLKWLDLPIILKNQIETLYKNYFEDTKNKNHNLNDWKDKLSEWKRLIHSFEYDINDRKIKITNQQKLNDLLTYSCLFYCVNSLFITTLSPDILTRNNIYCYDENGNASIKFTKTIVKRDNVRLFEGQFLNDKICPSWGLRKVVVKLFLSSKMTTKFEIDNYRILGDPSPSLGVNCYFWDIPVLVMRPMECLNELDNEIDVGVQILQQLPFIHRVNVHSDIKPKNIMKFEENKQFIYKLIDFGGFSKERLGDHKGYNRRTYTKDWTKQRGGDRITPMDDLLELGETLAAIQEVRENPHQCIKHGKIKYPEKRTFKGNVKLYMNYIKSKINPSKLKCNEYGIHYIHLENILKYGKPSDDVSKELFTHEPSDNLILQ